MHDARKAAFAGNFTVGSVHNGEYEPLSCIIVYGDRNAVRAGYNCIGIVKFGSKCLIFENVLVLGIETDIR